MARELGAKNLTAFKIQSGGTYGTAIPLKNCVSIKSTNNYKEIEYYSDCTTEYSSSNLQNVDVEIEMSSSLGLKLLAELTGQEYANGKMSTVVGGQIPQIALAYSIMMDDGNERRRVLYSLNLKKEEQNNETESEGEIWTFTGKAVPVEINGKEYVETYIDKFDIEAIEDEAEKASAKAEYESFFESVVLPA
ncbi:hypothetical protein [Clostridium tertium]|uniref:hypothetical protein n=1 Tax=Clostridium tertium TaxID=1559 RepID=UPI000DD022B3|nr:hypothetical protein [Clostridium tertium]